MDEHRLGLYPIVRRVWSPPGQRLIVKVKPRYEWLYVYGFVRPSTGESFWMVMPTVSIMAFNLTLQCFSQAIAQAPCYLLLDRAGWHTSDAVQFPDHVRPLFQPPYTPEVQPAEHLWPLIDQPFVNQTVDSLATLQTMVCDRCRWLEAHPAIVRSATCFSWWPQPA